MNDTTERRLLAFIGDTYLAGDDEDLDRDTPLIEWGILSSMRALRLVAWIQDEFHVTIPVSPDDLATVAVIGESIERAATRSVEARQGGEQDVKPLLS